MDDYELAQKYETVNLYRRGGAAKIELNRPESRNAWNTQFSVDLLAALRVAGRIPAYGRCSSPGPARRSPVGPTCGRTSRTGPRAAFRTCTAG